MWGPKWKAPLMRQLMLMNYVPCSSSLWANVWRAGKVCLWDKSTFAQPSHCNPFPRPNLNTKRNLSLFAKSPNARVTWRRFSRTRFVLHALSFGIIPAHLGAHTNKLNHNTLKWRRRRDANCEERVESVSLHSLYEPQSILSQIPSPPFRLELLFFVSGG